MGVFPWLRNLCGLAECHIASAQRTLRLAQAIGCGNLWGDGFDEDWPIAKDGAHRVCCQIGMGDDDLGAAICNDIAHFGRLEMPVDRRNAGTKPPRCLIKHEIAKTIAREQSNHIARAHAMFRKHACCALGSRSQGAAA